MAETIHRIFMDRSVAMHVMKMTRSGDSPTKIAKLYGVQKKHVDAFIKKLPKETKK